MPPKPRTDGEKLRFLGSQIQKDWAKTHPTSERSLETVRGAVLAQQTRKQEAERSEPAPFPSKGRTIRPPGPELDR